jgi:hypothetical protein
MLFPDSAEPAGAKFLPAPWLASSSQLFRGRYDFWHMRNRFDVLGCGVHIVSPEQVLRYQSRV